MSFKTMHAIISSTARALHGLAYVATALLMGQAAESTAADITNGQQIAKRWCAECHVVAPGQKHGSDTVPTFVQIGKSERLDEATLTAFLADPHRSRMPNLSLTRSEIADLVAYIKHQRRK
ncbi:cytochrome c family protein [Rhizobium ruizarguesonis]|uniref:c-type cytochrome n=1 Tax=Rhizobium ruizarguesonis TaxID=2081791 RepID=UPI001FE0D7C1|nr:c-type cytochrome [Rhizobium ruizarguesonis]WSH68245.1 c-type cytochrome [Rhizobium ruizarguesonis]